MISWRGSMCDSQELEDILENKHEQNLIWKKTTDSAANPSWKNQVLIYIYISINFILEYEFMLVIEQCEQSTNRGVSGFQLKNPRPPFLYPQSPTSHLHDPNVLPFEISVELPASHPLYLGRETPLHGKVPIVASRCKCFCSTKNWAVHFLRWPQAQYSTIFNTSFGFVQRGWPIWEVLSIKYNPFAKLKL